jgi:acetyl esterase/lipase
VTPEPRHPPFDPELADGLAALRIPLPTTLTTDMIAESRQATILNRTPDRELIRDGAFQLEERAVPGPSGTPDVSLLVCHPIGVDHPDGVLYYIHGGGMVAGDNRFGVPEVLVWAEELRLAVVSVDYRLAPEHPYPAAVEDCYAGLVWTVRNARELGVDPDRMVAVGGSAGGGLAAAVALLARDRGGPHLAGQMLMCPMLDDRNDTPSSQQMTGRGVWDRAANETAWTAYLGERRAGSDVSPYAAPARAVDLAGLPPAYIDVGSAEVFRDEAVAYAVRIWQAGGQAELHVWPGGFHGFDGLVPQARISREAKAARLRWLARLLQPRLTPDPTEDPPSCHPEPAGKLRTAA